MQITKNPKNLLAILFFMLCTALLFLFISNTPKATSRNENSTTVGTSTITSTEKVSSLTGVNIVTSTEEDSSETDTNYIASTEENEISADTTSSDETPTSDTTENDSVIVDDDLMDTEESEAETSPSEQTLLDAGIGTVVLLPTGDYGILMQSPDHKINGKLGNEILREYLTNLNLEGSIYGCWMNDQYYNFFAENVQELITSDDEEFWD